METTYKNYGINNGEGLKHFLIASGLLIKNSSGLEGSQNVIILPDFTSFNWKENQGAVRVNCKENAVNVIERYTSLEHFDNKKSDRTRPYSFFVRNMSDLINVIYALKTVEGNSVLTV